MDVKQRTDTNIFWFDNNVLKQDSLGH